VLVRDTGNGCVFAREGPEQLVIRFISSIFWRPISNALNEVETQGRNSRDLCAPLKPPGRFIFDILFGSFDD
jgi:hypothetical protein